MLDNKVYEILKWVALIALPALATLVSVVLPLWNICDESMTTAVVGTITAVSTFLGTLLGVSTMKYRKNQ
mgnify:FL=1